MIQRVQTIFLLASTSLMAVLFFYPFAEIAVGQDILTFNFNGFYKIVENIPQQVVQTESIIFILGFIVTLNIGTVFMYKKRKLQMRFTVYNILLMTGMVGALMFLLMSSFEGEPSIEYKITMVFPLIAAVFNYMAFRNIRKDELLVRAVDRIR